MAGSRWLYMSSLLCEQLLLSMGGLFLRCIIKHVVSVVLLFVRAMAPSQPRSFQAFFF